LRLQLGSELKLWQDTVAIPEGALWESEIQRAISGSVFFIPIVTPSSVASKHCRFEFEAFLDREQALGRKNLVFPLLYVRVPALEKDELWREDDVLRIIGRRQYIDWREFRHRSFTEPEIKKKSRNSAGRSLGACSSLGFPLRIVEPLKKRKRKHSASRRKAAGIKKRSNGKRRRPNYGRRLNRNVPLKKLKRNASRCKAAGIRKRSNGKRRRPNHGRRLNRNVPLKKLKRNASRRKVAWIRNRRSRKALMPNGSSEPAGRPKRNG
jgi:hypothetical protein